MAERLFVDVSPQGTLVAPTAQARAALARRTGRWVLMPSTTNLLLLSQWEGPEVPGNEGVERAMMMGEVGGVGLLDLLGLFNQTRRSFRIVVSRGRVERAILLRDGDLASVASSDPRDRLGEFLVRTGKLSQAQLDSVVAQAQAAGKKLGQHLVASGALSSHDLWAAIQQQIMEIICDVVAWREGNYVVFSLPENFAFPQTPPLRTQALVLEAVRRADEMSMFREKLPTFDAVVVATGKMPSEAEPTDLAALQAAQTSISLRTLANKLQLGEFDATKVVFELVRHGALKVEASGAQEELPPPVVGTVVAPPQPVAMGAAPPRPAGPPTVGEIVSVFGSALREIDHELRARGAVDNYLRGLYAFVVDPQNAYAGLLTGVGITADGTVDVARVGANAVQQRPQDPARAAYDALNELTFFALFQASELLPQDVDEGLAKRVRSLLTTLQR